MQNRQHAEPVEKGEQEQEEWRGTKSVEREKKMGRTIM